MKIPRLLDSKKVSETSSDRAGVQENIQVANKVNELVELIGQSVVSRELAETCQQQIASAFELSAFKAKHVAPFHELDKDNNLSREELLEGLEKLLSENQIDSRINSPKAKKRVFQKIIIFILAFLLIVFGFAMIIMPAPPSFEMFTVFYFNPNDGITIMDLVSLLIIFGGVLLFVLNFNKK